MIMCGIVISQLDRMGETKLSRPTVMAAGLQVDVQSGSAGPLARLFEEAGAAIVASTM